MPAEATCAIDSSAHAGPVGGRGAAGLATLEAIARALEILEGDAGPEIKRAMLSVFRVMVERTLWFRGKLRDHEVSGGIPEAALANDPRGAVTRRSLFARVE